MIKLENRISVTIPKTNNKGNNYGNGNINKTIDIITNIAGGCTVTENVGFWISENLGRIKDENQVFTWCYNEGLEARELKYHLHDLIHQVWYYAKQEAVLIERDGISYILPNSCDHTEINEALNL